MAKKKIAAVIKLQCPAGKATPAPPVGPALGPHGVSAPQFVQQFNDRTKSMEPGLIIPVLITIYADKSFTFILKTPPAAVLIKKAIGLEKGAKEPQEEKRAKETDEEKQAKETDEKKRAKETEEKKRAKESREREIRTKRAYAKIAAQEQRHIRSHA